jgi:outer membrane protein assembly factor BamB
MASLAVVYLRSLPELERNLKGWLSAIIPLTALIMILLWFFVSRRFSWHVKQLGLVCLLVLGLGLKLALRVDGTVDGIGLPNFVWKWSTPMGAEAPPLTTQLAVTNAALPDSRLSQATDVPQFFGPQRSGSVQGAKLGRDWQKSPPKELWRQPIGQGWSAFAVVAGRAYTQEQRGEDELITCYDLFTGQLIWAHADKAHFVQWQGGDGPRATPTVDAGRVYAYGATGLLNCLDAATGKQIWQRSVLAENKLSNLEWGMSASPLIVEDRVIITGGHTRGSVLFAYQRDTGIMAWKAGDDQATYASPMLATLAGKRLILGNHSLRLTGYDPSTGAVLLDHAWGIDKWPKASQPVLVGTDRVFVSAGYGMGCQLIQVSADSKGTLTASAVWSGMKMKTQFNSPAALGGHLYGLDDGRLACIDLATGDRLWKEGRFGSGQTLLVDDLVLIQSESGPVHLAAASPAGFQELGKLAALSSKTWNHPVLAGRFLLVRNDREAVCYELPQE